MSGSGGKGWCADLHDMHRHYGFHEKIADFDKDKLSQMLLFRIKFLEEELSEAYEAYYNRDAEGIVDSLIDLCVVAIGTLDLYGVDGEKAWKTVHDANMNKQVGVKASRPNPLGLPDLIKPEGWVGPSHEDNHGTLPWTFGYKKHTVSGSDTAADDDII